MPVSAADATLAATLPATGIRWLERAGWRFLAVYDAPRVPGVRGGVLLLGDEGAHADWPHVLGPLRRALSEDGWHALSMASPPPPVRPTPTRIPGTDANDAVPPGGANSEGGQAHVANAGGPPTEETLSGGAQEPVSEPAPNLAERLGAGLELLRALGGGPVVLLGHGAGGAALLTLPGGVLSQPPPAALVLVSAPAHAGGEEPDALLRDSGLPVLDVLGEPDTPAVQAAAAARSQAARRVGKRNYTQVLLPGLGRHGGGDAEDLGARVRGWLRARTGDAGGRVPAAP